MNAPIDTAGPASDTAAYYSAFHRLTLDRPRPRVLRITLDRPDKGNTLDLETHGQLERIWAAIDDDPSVSVTVLTGAGRAFCVGGDLSGLQGRSQFETVSQLWRGARSLVNTMLGASKPIISAVNGAAAGAGLAVALAADISVVDETAKLKDAHATLGIVAGDHAVQLWPLLCGMAKAKYHLLLDEPLTGAEAERIGLISLAVPGAQLEERSLQIAERLAAGSPAAIRWTKHALNTWFRNGATSFDLSVALELLTFFDPNMKEGAAALRERRSPRFDLESLV